MPSVRRWKIERIRLASGASVSSTHFPSAEASCVSPIGAGEKVELGSLRCQFSQPSAMPADKSGKKRHKKGKGAAQQAPSGSRGGEDPFADPRFAAAKSDIVRGPRRQSVLSPAARIGR